VPSADPNWWHLEETDDGFKVTIRRSKTDQEGHGATIAIVRGHHACPVKAVKAWLAASGISEGPVFRPVAKGGRLIAARLSAKAVCEIVKAHAARLGPEGLGLLPLNSFYFFWSRESWVRISLSARSVGGAAAGGSASPPPRRVVVSLIKDSRQMQIRRPGLSGADRRPPPHR
jgi:hypothetical protein